MSLLEICPSSNPQGDIIALGELLVDFVPMEPEMKLCESGAVIKTASGSSGIFACAAANFAGHSSFLGKIGCDQLSRMVNCVVEKYGVNIFDNTSKDIPGPSSLILNSNTPRGELGV